MPERERGGNWLRFPFVSVLFETHLRSLEQTFQKCLSKAAGVSKKDYCVEPVRRAGGHSLAAALSPGDIGHRGRDSDMKEATGP